MTAADWQVSVPSRHVDDDGNVVVTVAVTDDTTGTSGTVELRITPARVGSTLWSIPGLADLQCWSTT